ncbi:lytic murein transglycosylase B [Marinoscillum sp.]|uniref:lytic murein transglycosylase B n=1 Tax=Marinoscillum sp. TaxID=2024838 RepID=UPI003BA9D4F3
MRWKKVMKMGVFKKTIGFVLLGMTVSLSGFGQVNQVKVAEFARSFSDRNDMSLEEVTVILNNARYQESIIQKMEKPAEGTMTWARYRKIFMTEDRIAAGVEFWRANKEVIHEVSTRSGVVPEIIVGIIGVETFYGQRQGNYRVLDALYTLAFGFPKRSSFFTAELEKFLLLVEEENLNMYEIKGSYAGAMGFAQFMPSSYQAYAKSYDEGGSRNLMQADDAIASVANYLKEHRWKEGDPVAMPITNLINPTKLTPGVKPNNSLCYYSDNGYMPSGNLSPSTMAALIELEQENGMEYWFGFNNFYVITRYNHSKLYAMAVFQLAEAVKAEYDSVKQ